MSFQTTGKYDLVICDIDGCPANAEAEITKSAAYVSPHSEVEGVRDSTAIVSVTLFSLVQ